MTTYYMDRYFKNQMFYKIQSQSIVDNPDQRIVDDLSAFAGTTLAFSLTVFNAAVDLVSFSNILYGIYPPLFVVLLVYSLGGTAISILLGKRLVNLNFMQEKKEADFRYGLARIRENAESIAFYGGEGNEMKLLLERFRTAFENLSELLLCSRNLDFFTSGYRYLIQILPAAVVAPMYFSGKIEFGVINQSVSAFNHILSDVSLIVYQFQAISAFSAVIDRLGEFDDVLDDGESSDISDSNQEIKLLYDYLPHQSSFNSNGTLIVDDNGPLLIVQNLTLETPRNGRTLIHDLSLEIKSKDFLLVMGPSGCGKTSLLRSLAGLWTTGKGKIAFYTNTENGENLERSKYRRFNGIFFLPQKPYMVLGTLREQLLYPTWSEDPILNSENSNSPGSLLQMPNVEDTSKKPIRPTDDDLIQVLEDVRLGDMISRFNGLDSSCDWSSVLSLGEQQRLAFARLLLSKPTLVLLDESTSALDEQNEEHLYKLLRTSGITYLSIGHRKSLRNYHSRILQISRFHSGKNSDNGRNWHLELINPTGRSKPAEKLL